MSEILVGSISEAAESIGLSEFFIGVIIVAIVGNAAEHWVAVSVAMKDKMDLSVNIATMITPMKNSLSPIALGRVGDRADEDLRHPADGDAGEREREDRPPHRPRLVALLGLLVGDRVEQLPVGLEREEEPRDVGGDQHARDERREHARPCGRS